MRTIGVVTVARSDYGSYRPVLRRITKEPSLDLMLFVTGMHLSPEFGGTAAEIEADGYPIAERVEMLVSSDSPEGLAKSIGLGTIGFAQVFARTRPDILVVLGDRYEMLAAATAALPFNIPIAHLHGGESTEGAIDESIRHSLTKMAHLHLASTTRHGNRIIQMGEEPWRVTVSGAPGLDNLDGFRATPPDALRASLGLDFEEAPLLVTYHPVTRESQDARWQVQNLLDALSRTGRGAVFTYPNADTEGRSIISMINDYAARNERMCVAANLGTQAYFSLMSHASAMVGNSSSGIIEAASFELPVVNIGTRQRGRLRAENVIDVGYGVEEIVAGVATATSAAFRHGLRGMANPYGDGHAAERIVDVLRSAELNQELLLKRFHEPVGMPI